MILAFGRERNDLPSRQSGRWFDRLGYPAPIAEFKRTCYEDGPDRPVHEGPHHASFRS